MDSAISSVISSPVSITSEVPSVSGPSSTGFGDVLRNAVDKVQQAQGEASQSVNNLLEGNGEDLHKAMIAVEKADLSFQLMMEVRNKIISAYQEVSRMNF